jgi:hypothetical protein
MVPTPPDCGHPSTIDAIAATFRYALREWARGPSCQSGEDRTYWSGRSPDWIKVKNPDVPAITRLLE